MRLTWQFNGNATGMTSLSWFVTSLVAIGTLQYVIGKLNFLTIHCFLKVVALYFGCQLDAPYGFPGDHQQNAAMFQCYVHFFFYNVFSIPVSLLYSVGNKTYYYYCNKINKLLIAYNVPITQTYQWNIVSMKQWRLYSVMCQLGYNTSNAFIKVRV